MSWKVAFLFVACMNTLLSQTQRVVVLEVEVENSVVYRFDVFDASKLAVNPNPATPLPDTAFREGLTIDDVVMVNGRPAKGLHFLRGTNMYFNPAPQPGFAIADASQGGAGTCNWEFLSRDGRFVGRLVDGGFFPHSILGGAGAFFGARGEHSFTPIRPQRITSVVEDPARRRILGGGAYRVTFSVVPMFYPEVELSPQGPAIFHGDDFTLVTPARPARPNEQLIVRARNLGPTSPDIPRGQPFPTSSGTPRAEVNADVEVTVNGESADVINKIGWPGESNVYRVDFRVPGGTAAGMATIQVTAAWIPSDEVKIPVK